MNSATSATRRWALGIAIAIPLTVGVCVSAFLQGDTAAGK